MVQVPPLDAKLHFCHSWQQVHTPALSSSAFPAPLSLLLLWLCLASLLVGTFRLFILPLLRRVTSRAEIVARVFFVLFGVPSLFVDVGLV